MSYLDLTDEQMHAIEGDGPLQWYLAQWIEERGRYCARVTFGERLADLDAVHTRFQRAVERTLRMSGATPRRLCEDLSEILRDFGYTGISVRKQNPPQVRTYTPRPFDMAAREQRSRRRLYYSRIPVFDPG